MTIKSIDQLLENVSTVGLAGHVRPDGDCIGSTLGVYNYIEKKYPNIRVDLYLESDLYKFSYLKNFDKIQRVPEDFIEYDLFMSLDCGSPDRLGLARSFFEGAKQTLCIDHHLSNQSCADYNYIVPAASSTCELVYDLIDKEYLDKDIAACLYTGIISDTGVFQYECTSSKTMEVAGVLMDTGINFSWIVEHSFFTKKYEQLRITGLCFQKSVLHSGDRIISCIVSSDEIASVNAKVRHMDGIASEMRSTYGIEASILLYENEDGSYKMSLRSGEKVNVALIAEQYGGGGHLRAAGATIRRNPDQCLKELLTVIEKQLDLYEG